MYYAETWKPTGLYTPGRSKKRSRRLITRVAPAQANIQLWITVKLLWKYICLSSLSYLVRTALALGQYHFITASQVPQHSSLPDSSKCANNEIYLGHNPDMESQNIPSSLPTYVLLKKDWSGFWLAQ